MAAAPYTVPTSHRKKDLAGPVSGSASADSFSVGPYRVHDLIDRRHSGPVFRASHEKLRHTVALQVLQTPVAPTAEEKVWSVDRTTKFANRIENASRVVHDNVLRPIHHGEQNEVHFVAMEYVDGVSLRTILDREGAFDEQIACEVALQVATGLRHIHETGMVHGNIRPENVLLTKSGLIKISGLGIPDFETTEELESNHTSYLAPEQLSAEQIDERADIFALGCTLFELIYGQQAFDGEGRGSLPTPPEDQEHSIPPQLAATLAAMMACDPTQRLQSSNDVVHAMCAWANAERLPDLVAWHMNAANAGLAPAATFHELERREKARASFHSPSKRPSPQTASKPTKRNITAKQKTRVQLKEKLIIASLCFATLAVSACGIIVANQSEFFSGSQPTELTPVHRSPPIKVLSSSSILATPSAPSSPRANSYHAKLNENLTTVFGLPAGEWVMSPDENTPMNDAVHYGHMVTASAVAGLDFTRTVTMDVSERGGAPWDAGYFIPNISGIEARDRLLLVVWLRTNSVNENGELRIFCEQEETDLKDLYVTLKPNSQWQRFLIPFESKSSIPRRVGFHLASKKQIIECGGLAILNYRQTIPFSDLPHELHGEVQDSPRL